MSAYDMLDLIQELKENNEDLKFDKDQVDTIFNKLANGQASAYDMLDLIQELKKDNAELKFNADQVKMIFDKLNRNLLSPLCMLELIQELKKDNEKLKFDTDQVGMIFDRIDKNYDDIVGAIQLAVALKATNPDLVFNINHSSFVFINELDKQNKLSLKIKNDDMGKTGNLNDNNNGEQENNKEKVKLIELVDNQEDQNEGVNDENKVIISAIIGYLDYEAQNLDKNLDEIDNKKYQWKEIARKLDKGNSAQFQEIINNIYNLNGRVTFFRWLGCAFVTVLTLGLLGLVKPIRDTIAHPTNRRVFEYFQDNKNALIDLLQKSKVLLNKDEDENENESKKNDDDSNIPKEEKEEEEEEKKEKKDIDDKGIL